MQPRSHLLQVYFLRWKASVFDIYPGFIETSEHRNTMNISFWSWVFRTLSFEKAFLSVSRHLTFFRGHQAEIIHTHSIKEKNNPFTWNRTQISRKTTLNVLDDSEILLQSLPIRGETISIIYIDIYIPCLATPSLENETMTIVILDVFSPFCEAPKPNKILVAQGSFRPLPWPWPSSPPWLPCSDNPSSMSMSIVQSIYSNNLKTVQNNPQ